MLQTDTTPESSAELVGRALMDLSSRAIRTEGKNFPLTSTYIDSG
jgi:hypothetical protein